MIGKAIHFTKHVLEQFLKNEMGLDDTIVVSNSIIDSDGSLPKKNLNKVVISLINIEKETSKQFNIRYRKTTDGYSSNSIVERYNLDLLITSNFDHYDETLKFLNNVILFFQINPVISGNTSSNLPKGLEKLEFELENISFHQMHSLWNAMGAKYQPSVIYKTRLITLDANQIEGFEREVITALNEVAP